MNKNVKINCFNRKWISILLSAFPCPEIIECLGMKYVNDVVFFNLKVRQISSGDFVSIIIFEGINIFRFIIMF